MAETGKDILVVDDEPNIRLMLRRALESEGYEVGEAASGREALEAVARITPDLMILDLNMPELDGMGVLEALGQRPANQRPPVIVLTAYGSVSLSVKAIRLGALDFMEKPITPDELRCCVASALRHPHPEPRPSDDDMSHGEMLCLIRREISQRNYRLAEELLAKAATHARDDPACLNLLGVLHEAEGRRRLARKFYDLALRANPVYEPAEHNRRRLIDLETYGQASEDVALGNEAELPRGFPRRSVSGHALW